MTGPGISNGSRMSRRTIAIIGGGFSGAAVAFHVARSASSPIDILLFEPRGVPGRGLAYSSAGDHLLLNVPAAKLSIDPAEPGDFARWCKASGLQVESGSFMPRHRFGEYIGARLAQAVEQAGSMVQLHVLPTFAERIESSADGLRILAGNGNQRRADHVVLALGNGPTRIPDALAPIENSEHLLRSPWDDAEMSRIASGSDRVLLVGTGLTMCDAAITLHRHGFKGQMMAVSRRGLIPFPHGPSSPEHLADWSSKIPSGSLRDILREIRRNADTENWRSVVDSLRPHTARLWAGLSEQDRIRFMNRLCPYWDVHRHRLPPEAWAGVRILQESGNLSVVRGRLGQVRKTSAGLNCEITGAGRARAELFHADKVILCTGPEPDPTRWNSPLIDQLVRDGIARPDPLGLGLRTTDDGVLVGQGAVVQHRFSTLGPLRRGSLWESTAVPELSRQAAGLAKRLVEAQPDMLSADQPVIPDLLNTTTSRSTT